MRTSSTPLSAAQASEMTSISKRTILAAIQRGALAAHKLPGRTAAYLIAPVDLEKWVTARQRRNTSKSA